MGDGFVEVEHEAGNDHVGGERGGVERRLRRRLAGLDELGGILRMRAVVLEGAIELALKHGELRAGGCTGEHAAGEELQARGGVAGLLEHLRGEGARGLRIRFVAEEVSARGASVREVRIADAALGAVVK